MGSAQTGPGLSRGHIISFRTGLGHGQLLAGLVWHHSVARRIDHGRGGRAGHRGAARCGFGDLRERSGASRRKAPDQTLHRIHFRDSIGRARIFRNRRCGRGGARVVAIVDHAMGAVLSDQRTAQCFYGGLFARAHGGADNFHARGRRAAQCPARIQGSLLRAGREPAANDRARARAGVAFRNYLRDLARARPRHRRDHGGVALRAGIALPFPISPRASARFSNRSTP